MTIMTPEQRAALLAQAQSNNDAVKAAMKPKLEAYLALADEIVELAGQLIPTADGDENLRIQNMSRNAVQMAASTMRAHVLQALTPPVTPVLPT